MKTTYFFVLFVYLILFSSCITLQNSSKEVIAKDILGNPEYPAISYGGYLEKTREEVPSVAHIKEDMKILSAMNVKIIRTYNTQQYEQAANLLKAIRELKQEDKTFEMYVMLGAWIDCKGAWGDFPDHEAESLENNEAEINAAVKMANEYPDIVKIIAVGNEAMVHWASSYFVQPKIILKYVNHLQELKNNKGLPEDVWITSSDNFASWGGSDNSYHIEDLTELIKAVDYISLHTYPFHDTHYNPAFWSVPEVEESLSEMEKIDAAMLRAFNYAKSQYQNVVDYVESLGIKKPIHIGETGWASVANTFYDAKGSGAADEYKEKLYYQHLRQWTDKAGISCFYFEAFDEQWKDSTHVDGPENHFGLIKLNGEAKYALWDLVDEGVFKGLTRNGKSISKSFQGDESLLLSDMVPPPLSRGLGAKSILTVNEKRNEGDKVTERSYVIISDSLIPDKKNDLSYPSAPLKINPWEGSCAIEMSSEGIISIQTGESGWWGCGLELQADGLGEDLSGFGTGRLHFDIKGNTKAIFQFGFQSGIFAQGNQTNNYVLFGPGRDYVLKDSWQTFSIQISELNMKADFSDITSPIYLRADHGLDGGNIFLKNIYYTRD